MARTIKTTGVLEAALAIAALGWPVFPCRGKVPAFAMGEHEVWAPPAPHKDVEPPPAGLTRATTDAAVITAHWPTNANITVATPGVPGLLVFDVDVPKDKGAYAGVDLAERQAIATERYEQLRQLHPFACWVRTPSGGYHGYAARWPDSTNVPATGPYPAGSTDNTHWGELRGNGAAYVILPGGRTRDGTYQVLEGAVPAIDTVRIASAELVTFTTPPRAGSNGEPHALDFAVGGAGATKTIDNDPKAYARGLLEGVMRRLGTLTTDRNLACRNEALTLGRWVGGYQREGLPGLTERDSYDTLLRAMIANGDHNENPSKAEKTIWNGLRNGIDSAYTVTHQPRRPSTPAPRGAAPRDPSDPGPTEEDGAGLDHHPAREAQAWDGPPPQPLPVNTREAPTLPDDLLPEPLREWAIDAAQRASVPVDSFLPGLLVTLAATAGNRWRIRPKQHDPWTVVPNLWGALVQPPGQMKSYVIGATTGFLRHIELEERDAHERDRIADEVDADIRDAELKNLQDELQKLLKQKATAIDRDRVRADLITAKTNAQQRNAPPTLIVQDTTTETLVELLRDNPRGLLLVRDELHGWYSSLHKQGREGDRAFYLEAHDGDKRYSQHRIKRGHTEAPIVTLNILGGIQPARLSAMQNGAITGEDADGLLQRFQILVWPDRMPPYRLDDRRPQHDLEGRVAAAYRALYNLDPARFGYCNGEPGVVHFDPSAQKMFYGWLEQLEHEIRAPENQTKPAWASYLGKTRSLMPSIALLLHLLDLATGRASGVSVTPEATDRAARLTDYLAGHAAKLYAPELDREAFAGRLIALKIADGAINDGDTIRDLYRANWAGLGRGEIEAGLAYLSDLGWIRIDRETGERGGRPSETLRVHPDARGLAEKVLE